MTREEAIDFLKASYPDSCYESLREAFDIAIEALHQLEQPIAEMPTEKQISYATYLAQRMCVELPKETTKRAYSAFISKWKPIVAEEDKGMNEPSEWQLRYS